MNLNITTPHDVKDKTCWLFLKDGAKSHSGEQFESNKILGRISAVNDNTLTLRDIYNKPRLLRLQDIERIVKCNSEFHINFMKMTLENILC